jgi:4-hydroxythreonine-4-phosphate dehydrogenase
LRPIGVTLGDPAGVGPEVLLRALEGFRFPAGVRVFGDRGVLEDRASRLGLHADLAGFPGSAGFALQEITRLPGVAPGTLSPEGAKAQVEYLRAGAQALADGSICALVTGPIHKRALRLQNEPGPGQTE